jgi:hypothetical protein
MNHDAHFLDLFHQAAAIYDRVMVLPRDAGVLALTEDIIRIRRDAQNEIIDELHTRLQLDAEKDGGH